VVAFILIALLQTAAGEPTPSAETTSAPVQATQQGTPEEGEAVQQPAPEEERRCRNERVLGSRMPVRVCRTAAEEAQMEAEAREMVRRAYGTRPMD
jgi:hypothetical protein